MGKILKYFNTVAESKGRNLLKRVSRPEDGSKDIKIVLIKQDVKSQRAG